MGMIGNPADNSLRKVANDSYNGDGSTTVFTLSAAVNSATDIEVLVDNVQQSPYDASYTASGTTLTFSEAPASGTNNIYVIYHVGRTSVVGEAIPQDGSVTPTKLDRNYIPGTSVEGAMTTQFGRRNLIINGAMQVWQRGTDTGSIQLNQFYGAADRWRTHGSGGTYRATQQEITAGDESDIGGLQYFHRFDVSTGDNYTGVFYSIEDVRSVPSEETFTISFYAKGTNPGGGHMDLRVRQTFGSGGSTQVTVFTEPFTLTSSWQRFEITKTMPSLSGKTISDTDSTLELFFQQPADDTSTDAWTFDLTGVQLELGSVATPFEHRSYGEELALCQRYFHAMGKGETNSILFQGYGVSGNNEYPYFTFPVKMRAKPTATVVGSWNFVNVSSITFEGFHGTDGAALKMVISGTGVHYINNDSTSKYFTFDAEI